jgi:hypothetical protein
MAYKKTVAITLLLAVLITLASIFVKSSTHASYLDADCAGSCQVAAAGFPFPFIADYPGISPVGSVSLFDAILGYDDFLIGSFVASYMYWTAIIAIVVRLLSTVRK